MDLSAKSKVGKIKFIVFHFNVFFFAHFSILLIEISLSTVFNLVKKKPDRFLSYRNGENIE